MKMEFKRYTAEVEGAGDTGEFEAIVSVFGNVDSYGDRMIKGAFSRSLAERGLPPIYWNHAWTLGQIGDPIDAEERDEGLWIKGRLWVDLDDPMIHRVYRGMLGPARTEFSFAYQVAADGFRIVEEDGGEVREITDVDLYEVGPVTVGANDETELIRVASLLTPQMLDAKHKYGPRHVQSAHDALVLAGARCAHADDHDDDEGDGDGKAVARDTAAKVHRERLARLLTRRDTEEGTG